MQILSQEGWIGPEILTLSRAALWTVGKKAVSAHRLFECTGICMLHGVWGGCQAARALTNMVPSKVGLLLLACASGFGEVGSVPSASSSVYLPSLPRSRGYKQPFTYTGNWD